MPNKCIYLNII